MSFRIGTHNNIILYSIRWSITPELEQLHYYILYATGGPPETSRLIDFIPKESSRLRVYLHDFPVTTLKSNNGYYYYYFGVESKILNKFIF